MANQSNPQQLVLRRDTATGMSQVGWAADLPTGRFEHLALVCEVNDHCLPVVGSDQYAAYLAACEKARAANALLLQRQVEANTARGWRRVPFHLVPASTRLAADDFGNFAAAATHLLFLLTHNHRQAWAVCQQGSIVHVRTRKPPRAMEELAYQVWYHTQITELAALGELTLSGSLLVAESGLWFCEQALASE